MYKWTLIWLLSYCCLIVWLNFSCPWVKMSHCERRHWLLLNKSITDPSEEELLQEQRAWTLSIQGKGTKYYRLTDLTRLNWYIGHQIKPLSEWFVRQTIEIRTITPAIIRKKKWSLFKHTKIFYVFILSNHNTTEVAKSYRNL